MFAKNIMDFIFGLYNINYHQITYIIAAFIASLFVLSISTELALA